MAIDGLNRYTGRNSEESFQKSTVNLRDLLVDSMHRMYPNDPVYREGRTYISDGNADALKELDLRPINDPEKDLATRNSNNILSINSSINQKAKYKLNKMLPTIDDFDLDDLLEDEFDFYLNEDLMLLPRVDGLFVINREISINPPDFHDAYMQSGPATLLSRIENGQAVDIAIASTFCVFYIQNSTALPIPNYKTLEVMLVERSKTYDDITEATQGQTKEFDLTIDGRYYADIDGNPRDPYQEFLFRQVLDRTIAWSPTVRFQSGYTPGIDQANQTLYRDPGDYRRSGGMNEIGAEIFNAAYKDIVYQKQTYREKLRERFEGKMVILQWPGPATVANGFDDSVEQNTTDIRSDDKIFLVRIMINGYWKGVVSQTVMRQYALINNIDLSGIYYSEDPDTFDEVLGGSAAAGYVIGGLYTEDGLINAIIQGGGATVLQDADVRLAELEQIYSNAREAQRKLDEGYFQNQIDAINDELARANRIIRTAQFSNWQQQFTPEELADAQNYVAGLYGGAVTREFINSTNISALQGMEVMAKELAESVNSQVDNLKSPGWSDFPHIVEADRLDATEYQNYIDNYSNGLEPFDIEYLQPYEPAGSVKYYPSSQLAKLFQQAADQAAIDVIRKQIMELLPELNSRANELDERFKAQPSSYEEYAIQQLGPESDIYNVMCEPTWELKKRKNNKKIKNKGSAKSIFKLFEKKGLISRQFNEKEEDRMVYDPSANKDFYRCVGKNDGILTLIRQYKGKLLTENWIKRIDLDGNGLIDTLLEQQAAEDRAIANTSNAIGGATDNISSGIENFGANANDSIDNASANAGGAIAGVDVDIETNLSFTDSVDLPGDALDNLNDDITNGLSNSTDAINNITGTISDSVNQGLDAAGNAITNAGDAIGDAFENAGDALGGSIRRAGASFEAGATKAIAGMYDVIGKVTQFIVSIDSPVDIGDELDFDDSKRKRIPHTLANTRSRKFMKDVKYHKLCMATYLCYEKVRAEVSGLVDLDGNSIDIFEKGNLLDLVFGDYRDQIDEVLQGIQDVDQRVMASTKVEEFRSIYDELIRYDEYFDNIDLTVFEQGEDLKSQIDEIVVYMISNQYNAIQYIRQKVNAKGKNKKYFIPFSKTAQSVIEEYYPGKTFTNHNHPDYEP